MRFTDTETTIQIKPFGRGRFAPERRFDRMLKVLDEGLDTLGRCQLRREIRVGLIACKCSSGKTPSGMEVTQNVMRRV